MLVRLKNERKCSNPGRRQGHEKDQDLRETRLNAISAASFRELCLCESLTLHEVVGHVTTGHVADHVTDDDVTSHKENVLVCDLSETPIANRFMILLNAWNTN